ncbi:MAG: branched-chain amino acid ABC transporter ATP-binding protein/permease [Acidimicrobiales bacterium]
MTSQLRPIRAWHVALAWLVFYFPWLPGFPLHRILPGIPFFVVNRANQAGEYALIAFSLVLLTGWVGQISLGQGAFVGIGAFTTALIVRHLDVPFPANLPLVAVITAAVATALGVVALRVRGLYLAVATLIFAWMCDAYLFGSSWFVGSGGASSIKNHPIGSPASFTFFDLSNKRVLYLVIAAAVAAAWYALVNLRDSKTGRAFFAVRGSEMAAVSLGIDVARYKLLAFALSGGLAGVAGNLMMIDFTSATPVSFQFTFSLFYLSLAVVGGVSSLGGGVAAGVLFAGLGEVFLRISFLKNWQDVVNIGLLLVVLLVYPGGLAALGRAVTDLGHRARSPFETGLRHVALRTWGVVRGIRVPARGRRASRGAVHETDDPPALGVLGEEALFAAPTDGAVDKSATNGNDAVRQSGRRRRRLRPRRPTRRSIDFSTLGRGDPVVRDAEEQIPTAMVEAVDWHSVDVGPYPLAPSRDQRVPVLDAAGIVVRFGGLTAVDGVSVSVREHEIVGLIGPNGAGKTTTFNAIAGLNEPAAGAVRIFGEDATRYPVHVRAQMGVGRTFQLIQLFSQLTVFDNILVGTHIHNATGVFSHLVMTDKAIRAERESHERVRLVVDMLRLGDVAERRVAGLPFGILRQVEIARALATGAPLLMLDEPASGLDNAETDELARLLRYVRAELGVSILLIEHDVRLVTSVCDYIYVMNRGAPLAEGTAADIQRDPDVVAAYLGGAESAETAPGTPALHEAVPG